MCTEYIFTTTSSQDFYDYAHDRIGDTKVKKNK